jgi:hypothetical protein
MCYCPPGPKLPRKPRPFSGPNILPNTKKINNLTKAAPDMGLRGPTFPTNQLVNNEPRTASVSPTPRYLSLRPRPGWRLAGVSPRPSYGHYRQGDEKRGRRCTPRAPRPAGRPPGRRRRRVQEGQRALSSVTSFWSDPLASPKSIAVLGLKNSSFSIPAKPAPMPRFRTMIEAALSAFRIGMP